MIAFTMSKAKVAQTPMLRHFDPDRQPVIVVYASKWAASAALLQEHDGLNWPVMYHKSDVKAEWDQLRCGGEGSPGPAPDIRCLVYATSIAGH